MRKELKAVCLSWEKLRLIYNGVLAVVIITLMTVFQYWDSQLGFYLIILPALVVIANVLYFAGPMMECCLCAIGVNSLTVRYLLFAAGSGLAVGLMFQALMVGKIHAPS